MVLYRLSNRKLLLVAGIAAAICYGNDRDVRLPHLEAMLPIGGKAGTEVEVTLWGDMLSNAEDVEFDCDDLSFELKKATAGKIEGTIRLAERAARDLTFCGPKPRTVTPVLSGSRWGSLTLFASRSQTRAPIPHKRFLHPARSTEAWSKRNVIFIPSRQRRVNAG